MIHKILFRLGFCKEEAKTVLLEASKKLCFCMCPVIVLSLMEYLDIKNNNINAKYLRRYGFTKKNFKKYIKLHHPELEQFITKDNSYDDRWIDSSLLNSDLYFKITQVKQDFLKYLANKL